MIVVVMSFGQRGNRFQLGESSPTSAIFCSRRQLAWNVHSQYSNTFIQSNDHLLDHSISIHHSVFDILQNHLSFCGSEMMTVAWDGK